MANKVMIEYGAKVDLNSIKASAKQMNDAISKSSADSVLKQTALKDYKDIEKALITINRILAQPKISQKDLITLRQLESTLTSGAQNLKNAMQGIGPAATTAMLEVEKKILEVQKTVKAAISEQKALFSQRAGVSYANAPTVMAGLKEDKTRLEAEKAIVVQQATEKSKIELEAKNKENIERIKAATSVEQKILSEYNKTYNQDLKTYEDYINRKEQLAIEGAQDTNKVVTDVGKASTTAAKQQMKETTDKLSAIINDPKMTAQMKGKKIKALQLYDISNLKDARKLVENTNNYQDSYFSKLKQKESDRITLQNKAIQTRKEEADYLKNATKEIEKQNKVRSTAKGALISPSQINVQSMAAGEKAGSKLQNTIDAVKARITKIGTAFGAAKTEIDKVTNATNANVSSLQREQNALSDENAKQFAVAMTQVANAEQKSAISAQNFATANGQAQVQMNKATVKSAAFGKVIQGAGSQLTKLVSGFYLFNKISQVVNKAVSTIKELDQQITDIGIVTKQTGDEIWTTFSTFNQAARDLSTTTLQYLQGAKIFYQQGMNTAEVMKMVEATTKAAALSGVSFTAASETLTAAINGYQMEATKAMEVTDKMAAVGAASASDFQELSTAMEKVASQAYSSGMSFDSLMGILAKGIETTREAPEAIGTGLKSIIARFQEMKENPMVDLEDGINANRVEKALKTVGVTLRDTNGEFRNMDDVFADLGESWKTMSRNQKAYIATMAAGSRQQSRFMAIMNNYDRTLQLIRTSTNSAGEANAQYAIYEDSVQAANNRLQNSFEALYASILSSDALKMFYDGLTVIIDAITEMNPLIVASILAIGALTVKVLAFAAAQKIAASSQFIAGGLQAVKIENLSKWVGKLAVLLGGAVPAAEGAATAGMVTFGAASAAALLPIVGVVAVLGLLVVGIIAAKKHFENARNEVHKIAGEMSKAADEQRAQVTNLDSLMKRYTELGKIINKTDQEKAEYNDLTKQLADEMPTLIKGIDAEGNYILDNNEALKEEIKLRQEKARQLEIEAFRAKQASMAAAEYNSTISQGAAGEKTATAGAAMDKILKGGSKITGLEAQAAQNNVAMYDIKAAIEADKSPEEIQKMIEKRYQLLEQSGAKAGEKFFDDEKKMLDDLSKEFTTYTKMKVIETQKTVATGLYNIGAAELQLAEFNGEEITNQYKDMVASFAKSATEVAAELRPEQVLPEDAGADAATKINKYSEKIQEGWINKAEKIRSGPGGKKFEAALKELTDLKKLGVSGKELTTQFETLMKDFRTPDNTEMMAQIEKNFFDQADFDKQMDNIGKHIIIKTKQTMWEAGKGVTYTEVIDDVAVKELQDKIAAKLMTLPTSTVDSIVNAIQLMDEGAAKQAFLEIIPTIYDGDAAQKEIEKEMKKLDVTDAVAVKQMTEKYTKFLVEQGGVSAEIAGEIAKSVIDQSSQTIEGFLDSVKKSYKELKTIQEDVKKSAEGLNVEEVLGMTQKYGGNAFLQIGETFALTGQAIQNQQLKAVTQYEQSILALKQKNTDEIAKQTELVTNLKDENGKSIEATAQQKQLVEATNYQLEQQNKFYDQLLATSQQLTASEKARAENQDVLTGINAIVATKNQINDLASLYDKLNEKSLSQLDIFDMIANNPDYLQYLVLQEGKLTLSTKLIEAETNARLENLKTTIMEAKKKVDLEVIALQALKNLSDLQNTATEDDVNRTKQAVQNYESVGMASEDTQAAIVDSLQAEGVALTDLEQIRKTAYEANMKRLEDERRAYEERTKAASGLASTTITARVTGVAAGGKVGGDVTKQIQSGSFGEKYFKDLGLKYGDYTGALNIKLAEQAKLQGELDWANKQTAKSFLGLASGASKASSSTKDLNDSLEKNYNLITKIADYESDLDAIQKKIDLQSTGVKEDLALLKEKLGKTNLLISLNKQLLVAKKNDLAALQTEMKMYGSWVQIQGDLMIIKNQQLLSSALGKTLTQEQYDAIVDYVKRYNDLSNSIEDVTSALDDLAAAKEEEYQNIIDSAIDTRKQMYNAMVEADQKEIDQLQAKYDKMTEMENEYTSAIKNAISEQRKAREESSKQEELIAKKRRLAVLQRDTSGLYATEAAALQKEIADAQQEARDTAVDKQMTALEEQIKLQQEQRDTQVAMLEEQQQLREDTGYYWDRVDDVIRKGPQAMQDLLASTQDYQSADPLAQQEQLSQFKSATEYLYELVTKGIAINSDQDNIVGAITAAANEIARAMGQSISSSAISANSAAAGAGGTIATGATSGTTSSATSVKTLEQQYNQGTSKTIISDLQNFLNTAIGTSLTPNGLAGEKTDSIMSNFLNIIIGRLQKQGGSTYLSDISKINEAKANKEITPDVYNIIKRFYSTIPSSLSGVKYKEGGLVNYTGPAWVDGTSNNPEAFLNARQTAIFASLRDLLDKKTNAISPFSQNPSNYSTTIGDIIINLQNPAGATAEEIAAMVKREFTGALQNRVAMPIQRVR